MTIRQIIKIDEDKCNGCGVCVPSCKEGALKIVNGKAKLVSDIYCDGLGACIGECPQGALTIENREAEEFDENVATSAPLPCGCPGMMARELRQKNTADNFSKNKITSELRQWPIQLALIPVNAPYLKNADIIFLADCVAVAYANLHEDFVRGRALAMACPKLDDTQAYLGKLIQMIKINNFRSVEVVMMEVPCCAGLENIVEKAFEISGMHADIKKTIISVEGEIINS